MIKTTKNIQIISAGAGSGKTYRLTQEMHRLLVGGLRPEGIIATTFTNKSAVELKERVRAKLLEQGMVAQSNALAGALIGTVHSVGLRLLQRFAFELGVSPMLEILPEGDERILFNNSLSQILTNEVVDRMTHLSDSLGMTKRTNSNTSSSSLFDWRDHIHQIIERSRSNNFSYALLMESKAHSWQSLSAYLYTPPNASDLPATHAEWLNGLQLLLEETIALLENNETDETVTTRNAVIECKAWIQKLKFRETLHWYDWAKIGKLKVAKKSEALAAGLIDYAKKVEANPLFRAELKEYTDTIFDLADAAMQEYQTYKSKRGYVDYTDMEVLLSQLLDHPRVRNVLAQEIDLLLVDEFQDTSPIQLEIFLKLSRLAKHSIWVGDPKQSIYGFRGAEPELMQAIIQACGGVSAENILSQSYRSRKDLVHSVNAIFSQAFTDLPNEQIVLGVARQDEIEQLTPALKHWHFVQQEDENGKVKGGTAEWLRGCIARELSELLQSKLLVKPNGAAQWQAVQPCDVAILCRSNKNCREMAASLQEVGIKSVIADIGLLETKEAALTLACIRYLLDPSDTLSTAEMMILSGEYNLSTMLDHRMEHLALLAEGNSPGRWASNTPFVSKCLELRHIITDLCPSEVIDVVYIELEIYNKIARYGNYQQRKDNLDKLRSMSVEYEDACQRMQFAASVGGFLLWLQEKSRNHTDTQAAGAQTDAVQILTYHSSKGLEYPVTICCNLETEPKDIVYNAAIIRTKPDIDLDKILAHRLIRFWVNPYSDQKAQTHLDTTIKESPEFVQLKAQNRAEEARLLYVGLTRARDYLIMPTTIKPTHWLNRVFSNDGDIPTLQTDNPETPFYYPEGSSTPVYCSLTTKRQPQQLEPFPALLETVELLPPMAGKQDYQLLYIDTDSEPAPCKWRHHQELRFGSPISPIECSVTDLNEALKALCFADIARWSHDDLMKTAKLQLLLKDCPEANTMSLVQQTTTFSKQCLTLEETGGTKQFHSICVVQNQSRICQVQVPLLLISKESVQAFIPVAPSEKTQKTWKDQIQAHQLHASWVLYALQETYPDTPTHKVWLAHLVEGMMVGNC